MILKRSLASNNTCLWIELTGFILKREDLENLEDRAFAKSQGKPGIVRKFSIIFIQVKEDE